MTTPLTMAMHITAFLLGAGSLLVAIGVKHTPFEWTAKLPKIEEKETEGSITAQIAQIENKFKRSQTEMMGEKLLA